jgi:hypothetical protein
MASSVWAIDSTASKRVEGSRIWMPSFAKSMRPEQGFVGGPAKGEGPEHCVILSSSSIWGRQANAGPMFGCNWVVRTLVQSGAKLAGLDRRICAQPGDTATNVVGALELTLVPTAPAQLGTFT